MFFRAEFFMFLAVISPGDSWSMPLVGIGASYLVGLHTHKSWMKLITSKLNLMEELNALTG